VSAEVIQPRGGSVFGIPARAVGLFLRSRQGWQAPVGFVLTVALATWCARRYDDQWLAQATALTLAPLLMACLIGAVAGSPFGEPERIAALPVPALRLGHLAGLILIAAGSLLVANAAFTWFEPPVEEVAVWVATSELEVAQALGRNLLLFAGVALLGARLLGAGLAWVGPLAYGMLSLVVLMLAPVDETGELIVPAWAVPVQPGADGIALLAAVGLLLVGLATVAPSGASGARGDEAG
jgi:hypothetical protein